VCSVGELPDAARIDANHNTLPDRLVVTAEDVDLGTSWRRSRRLGEHVMSWKQQAGADSDARG
jgi:hypothetical protein